MPEGEFTEFDEEYEHDKNDLTWGFYKILDKMHRAYLELLDDKYPNKIIKETFQGIKLLIKDRKDMIKKEKTLSC